MNEVPPFWTLKELHEFLGHDRISERSLYENIRNGSIPSLRIGRRVLIPSAPIVRLMERSARLTRIGDAT